jgi:hypothetical protein
MPPRPDHEVLLGFRRLWEGAMKQSKQTAKRWPMIALSVLTVCFIVGVWVNAYRVNHAQATVVSTK